MPTPRDLSKLTYINSNNFSVVESMIRRRGAYARVSYPLIGMASGLRFGTRMDVTTPTPSIDGWVMQPPMLGGYIEGRQLQFFFEKPFGRKVPSHTTLYEVSRQFLVETDAWIAGLVEQEVNERNTLAVTTGRRVYDSVKKQAVSEAYYAAESYAKEMIGYDARLETLRAELSAETKRQVVSNADFLIESVIEPSRKMAIARAEDDHPTFRVDMREVAGRAIDDAIEAVKTGAVEGCILPRMRL